MQNGCDIQVDGRREPCREAQAYCNTWKKLMKSNCHEWKLTRVDPQERSTWRSDVRSAMLAASQLPGRGSIDYDVDHQMMPLHLHINQISDFDMMMMMITMN